MKTGQASVTAQRVAAYRLSFDRLSAPFGEPDNDERLARDVAASLDSPPAGAMAAYLVARTAFFDRAVVRAISDGLTQVVVAGAGYDGRSLRYAKPGVRWYEVDHPDTQRDKRRRLQTLGITTPQVAFIEADFSAGPFAAALAGRGHDPAAPSLFVCEGLAVYLDPAVLRAVLGELRRLAGAGSCMAISLSVATPGGESARRERFQAAVSALGEPARSTLTADQADQVFASTGWQATPRKDPGQDLAREKRARGAGLVLVVPV